MALSAAIFDVDGVLVASPHERAWREALAGFADPAGFTTAFYQANVAGRRRLEGARSALEQLGVADAAARAPAYAAAKQALVDRLIAKGSFDAFPDAVRLATGLRAAGLRLALASSSKNTGAMLRRLTLPDGGPLLSIFDADLSGRDVPRGKPDPALFLLAAKTLGVSPAQCLVVEDAPAGIAAARAGGMAALGIARLGDEALLRAAGAGLVVTSLDQVDIAAVAAGELRARPVAEAAPECLTVLSQWPGPTCGRTIPPRRLEYHEDVDDNAFTNVMARWNIARALETIDLLRARWPDHAAALRERLALGEDELADWRDAVMRIVTGLDPATGLFEQFAGFHALEPLDLAAYRDITVPIDVVIGRERTRHAQVVKQADVVALLALLPEEFPGAMAETNFRHYEPRCAHGSSLSAGFHALVAARLGDSDTALRYLREAAALDLDPDPTSAGGVRMAGLGGVWQAVVLGFAGLDLMGDVLGLDPKLPPEWGSLSFRVHWRGRIVQVAIASGVVQATLTAGAPMELRVAGSAHKLAPGATLEVSLQPSRLARSAARLPRCRPPPGGGRGYTFRTTRPSILLSRIRAKMLLMFSRGSTE